MATKITKWTRERGGRKDFVDPTRRSHQSLTYHLSGREADRMREMAMYDKSLKSNEESEKIECKEDAVVRKRIEALRAQLHNVTIDKVPVPTSPPSDKAQPSKSMKELKEEARRRKDMIRTARSYIPATFQPITPKQRGQRIHTQVMAERAVQVKEKLQRIREKEKEDDKWAKRVVKNHEKFLDDEWRERVEKLEKKDKLKKDLDKLCEDNKGRRQDDKEYYLRMRQDIEQTDQLYNKHQQHWQIESNKDKLRNREKALRDIEDIREYKIQEAIKEEKMKEEDLRYSAFKRAYARRVKQRILDKMHGKRPTIGV